MTKIKKQEWFDFEALDRTSTIIQMVNTLLTEHQSIISDETAKDLVNEIDDILGELYVYLGSKIKFKTSS